MLISRNWLQTFFSDELPTAEELEHALMFHAFEIDGIEQKGNDSILDVKVTPNRGHDCLSHAGIAKEISAILKLPLKSNPYAAPAAEDTLSAGSVLNATNVPSAAGAISELTGTDETFNFSSAPVVDAAKSNVSSIQAAGVRVSIETDLCSRYIAAHIKNIKVGPSPDWLREHLESVGQRSINNVVDATNYIMFHLGQPLHAFDAGKLQAKDGIYTISVRVAKSGEKMIALDEKEYTLSESVLVIASGAEGAHLQKVIGVAGVKGGMPAVVTEATTDIIIESANFDGVSTRKTAQALKLRTDASTRFEQVISPELAAHGMRAVVNMILDLAGGELTSVVDVYPHPQEKKTAGVSVEKINRVLGVTLTGAEVADVFQRLGFGYKEVGGVFEVVVPSERLDLEIPEDLVEEVGRIVGYDHVLPKELPPLNQPIEINKNFYWSEKIREFLTVRGFSEVFTSVFADQGERVVLNKVDGVKPYMRDSLISGLQDALTRNQRNKDLLKISQVRLFEIGIVWRLGREILCIGLAVEEVKKQLSVADFIKELDKELGTQKLKPNVTASGPLGVTSIVEIDLSYIVENLLSPDTYDQLELSQTDRYELYSKYPYIVRDVAFWIPDGIELDRFPSYFLDTIDSAIAGSNLEITINFLDQFQRDTRTSLAYRLIFQSFNRTLTDEEVNSIMEKVYTKLKAQEFEIR